MPDQKDPINKSSSSSSTFSEKEILRNIGADTVTSGGKSQFQRQQELERRTKYQSDCREEQVASLKCIEENYFDDKDKICKSFFDNYKDCRRRENQRRLEENARLTGNTEPSFFSGWFQQK